MSQVTIYQQAINATNLIYRVTLNKTLYLNQTSFSMNNYSGAARIGALSVYDDVGAFVYYIDWMNMNADGYIITSNSFPKSLQIPSQYYIYIHSNGLSCVTFGFIHGFEM